MGYPNGTLSPPRNPGPIQNNVSLTAGHSNAVRGANGTHSAGLQNPYPVQERMGQIVQPGAGHSNLGQANRPPSAGFQNPVPQQNVPPAAGHPNGTPGLQNPCNQPPRPGPNPIFPTKDTYIGQGRGGGLTRSDRLALQSEENEPSPDTDEELRPPSPKQIAQWNIPQWTPVNKRHRKPDDEIPVMTTLPERRAGVSTL